MALKILPKKLAFFLENSDFWQYLPSLAPSGNPALNASAAAVITRTAVLVQSSSYSRAVLFRCEQKFVLSG